jgi:hypothetical protein
MAVKGKVRYRRKTSRRNSTSRHSRRHTRRSKTNRRRGVCMRGGNYEKDVTRRTLQGFPMKRYNEVVTTMPGYGTMSVSAYLQLQEDLDRNGKHYYD